MGRSAAQSCPLPHDVVPGVLTGLPAKSVARFLCVSKAWSSLILHDPTFSSSYRNIARARQQVNPTYLVQHRDCELDHRNSETDDSDDDVKGCNQYRSPDYFSLLDGKTKKVKSVIENPCHPHHYQNNKSRGLYRLLGFDGGLVLVGEYCGHVYLWNPSINKVKALAPFPDHSDQVKQALDSRDGEASKLYDMITYLHGMCNNNVDCKVVRICSYVIDWHNEDIFDYRVEGEAFVYSLSTDSWKRITSNDSSKPGANVHIPGFMWPVRSLHKRGYSHSHASLNGTSHWIAQSPEWHWPMWGGIMTFNYDSEEVGGIKLPPYDSKFAYEHVELTLGIYKDLLSVMITTPATGMSKTLHDYNLWVLKDYREDGQWEHSFRIESVTYYPVSFGCDAQVLMSTEGRKKLCSIGKEGAEQMFKVKAQRIKMSSRKYKLWDIIPYTESLALLDQGTCLPMNVKEIKIG
ncbi:hypothetical protein Tsubulata_025414 [Turnera subulata]|uniref:F-box domain-containing protein n=1 Tax=Turnera subulata TaxID=218843 RepID=A0A9Q0JKU1_9ROSI|nr:hypothetical protein Tsubulata_025414 [Turnera subulata]